MTLSYDFLIDETSKEQYATPKCTVKSMDSPIASIIVIDSITFNCHSSNASTPIVVDIANIIVSIEYRVTNKFPVAINIITETQSSDIKKDCIVESNNVRCRSKNSKSDV